MPEIIKWDIQAFLFINKTCANGFFDLVMPWLREGNTWIPLYAVLIYLLFKKFGWKRALFITGIIALVIVIGDSVLAEWSKFHFKRLRPCYEPSLAGIMQMRVDSCGGQFSFFSSHATNHFAMALIFSQIFGTGRLWLKVLFYTWAFLIIFAQVYVGKHYPADVLTGALVGLLLGMLAMRGIRYIIQK